MGGITDHLASSTYYDRYNRQTAALIRARRPFLIKNIIGGVTIFGLAVGIYAYTIKVIGQDDFSDVVPPPEEDTPIPSQPAHTPNVAVDRTASRRDLNRRRDAALSRIDRAVGSPISLSWPTSWSR